MTRRDLLEKHRFAIECAIKYYVKNQPTGISDYEYDKLEAAALADGLSIRDIALSKIKGDRIRNQYIESVPKVYAGGSMYEAIKDLAEEYGIDNLYVEPKYDGSGVAAYYDEGTPVAVVTCGGSNKSSDEGGVDQTEKLLRYFPYLPKDILAVQCEVLVPRTICDRPRQLCNGIINSKNKYSTEDIDNMICIRGFRYFSNKPRDFMDTLRSFPSHINSQGTLYNFAAGHVMTVRDLLKRGKKVVDQEFIDTLTGSFLIDGYVFYTKDGKLIKALKFKNAGGQESVEVERIQWNDLTSSKDAFSSNVILKDGVDIRGSIVKKPSSNGVNNLIRNNITPGARVSVTLRGSTIPCVDKVFSPGNGDFNWPVCKCGTQLGPNDVFGNNLKCPNPLCSSRVERMSKYVSEGRFSFDDPRTYNGLLVIDRLKLEDKISDPVKFSGYFRSIILRDSGAQDLLDLFLTIPMTGLQKRNLALVIRPAYKVLTENSIYLN
jgi:hypothetical protein